MKHEMVEKLKVFYAEIKAICNQKTGTAVRNRITLLKKKFIFPAMHFSENNRSSIRAERHFLPGHAAVCH